MVYVSKIDHSTVGMANYQIFYYQMIRE